MASTYAVYVFCNVVNLYSGKKCLCVRKEKPVVNNVSKTCVYINGFLYSNSIQAYQYGLDTNRRVPSMVVFL